MGGRKSNVVPSSAKHELVITRVFDAPRTLVFDCWSDSTHLAHWSGPQGFTTPHHAMDFRVAGTYRACLRSPDGVDHWVRGTYLEIVKPERLVLTHAWEDGQGDAGPETVVTVTFAEQSGKTIMTFRQAFFESAASRDGHQGGWSSSFDRLDEHLTALRSDGRAREINK
jgi:uncharacterized protein YndB with AHSA1/START domain